MKSSDGNKIKFKLKAKWLLIMKMTGKLSILIFLCKTNCGSIQCNSEGGRVSNKSCLVSPSCRKMSNFQNI